MSTFLQLVNDLERESGTIDRYARTSDVTAPPTNRQEKMVQWVREAWDIIQTARNDWRFMRGEFSAFLTPGQSRYTAADLNVSDLGQWPTPDRRHDPMATLDPDNLNAQQQDMAFLQWRDFKARWIRRPSPQNRPTEWSVDLDGMLCVGSTPDRAYGIAGDYVRAPQQLAQNGDIPRCPPQYHDVIKWRALVLLSQHDEAQTAMAIAHSEYLRAFRKLVDGTTDPVEF